MVQKVVYNSRHGGYGVDEEAVKWMREQGDEDAKEATLTGEYYDDGSGPRDSYLDNISSIPRTNELLVALVEGEADYGGKVSGSHASLRVAEVPDGVDWVIDQYDGKETVKEKYRTF